MNKFHLLSGSGPFVLALSLVLLGMVVACASSEAMVVPVVEPTVVSTPIPTPIQIATELPNLVRVLVKPDYSPANSITEMFEDSDVVVFGRVSGVVDEIDLSSWSARTDGRYELGRVYEIEVDEYLRGDGPGVITFVQGEANYRYEELTDEALAEIRASVPYYEDGALRFGEEYFFFLRNWHVDMEHFVAAKQPYRVWVAGENGIVEGYYEGSGWGFTPADVEDLWGALRELRGRLTP